MSFSRFETSEASTAHGLDSGLSYDRVQVLNAGHDELIQQGLQGRVQVADILASHLDRTKYLRVKKQEKV